MWRAIVGYKVRLLVVSKQANIGGEGFSYDVFYFYYGLCTDLLASFPGFPVLSDQKLEAGKAWEQVARAHEKLKNYRFTPNLGSLLTVSRNLQSEGSLYSKVKRD